MLMLLIVLMCSLLQFLSIFFFDLKDQSRTGSWQLIHEESYFI